MPRNTVGGSAIETPPKDKRPVALVLDLDWDAFSALMRRQFKATGDAAIGEVLGFDRSAISKLRRRETIPSIAFIAALRSVGVDDRRITNPVQSAEIVRSDNARQRLADRREADKARRASLAA